MTDNLEELEQLAERLNRFATRPIEHDAPVMNRTAMGAASTALVSLIATAREVEGLRAALSDAIALIGHRMPMDTTALVAGEKLVAFDVWRAGVAALGAKP